MNALQSLPKPAAPGLHLVELTRRRSEPHARRRGVPLFVGFGARSEAAPAAGQPAIEIDRWEQFAAWVHPEADSFLGTSVAGFFANGGSHCMVLSVPHGQGAAGLAAPFAPGGSAEDVVGVDLVCVPDAVSSLCAAPPQAVQAEVVRHCEAMGDRFAVLDLPPGQEAEPQALRAALPQSAFAAAYYPAVRAEPRAAWRTGERMHTLVPPCGHVAGVYARSDARHGGVHKAPANEIVEAVLATGRPIDEQAHARLNEAGINCIRSLPGRGIRVMGARTLSHRSGWRYVPAARLVVELTRWLKNDMADIAFEANTPQLWQQVRRRLMAYGYELMRGGALAGEEPDQAFFVKCDEETNPPEVRDTGRLVAEVGLAPSVPAEFVVVRITHDASGIAVTGI